MKVIDILNKIAKGEEVPKKIKLGFREYTYRERKSDGFIGFLEDEHSNSLCEDWFMDNETLNKRVEIIEEDKKIEKIDQNDRRWHYGYNKKTDENVTDNLELLREKVNEIIDYINKEK